MLTPGGAAPVFSPQDTQDPNPLIRALAVRTMGCIRVDKIVEYLCEPLRKCLKDEDPYVRKTAAVCVAKLYDINGELVEDQGFLDMVYDLLGHSNPMVVSNAVAALAEISETSETAQRVFQINTSTLQKMLAALNECTEWGQVFILDSLALYNPAAATEAESIIERVTPRLQHANSAVVLSAIKVMIKYMDLITSQDTLKALYKKMAPPLVTLLSSEPEIQYVALRNINLIVQKRPTILAHEIKVFFCKYNDPIYVKMEKLEIMIKLASERNVDQARTAPHAPHGTARHGTARSATHCLCLHLRRFLYSRAAQGVHLSAPHRTPTPPHRAPPPLPGADGAQGVLDRGRRRVRPPRRARHRPLRHQARARRRAVHQRAARAHPDQGQLRRAGGGHRHQGHLPQVPQPVSYTPLTLNPKPNPNPNPNPPLLTTPTLTLTLTPNPNPHAGTRASSARCARTWTRSTSPRPRRA